MADVVIDTDVASLIRKARLTSEFRERLDGQRIWLTVVSIGELNAWPEVRNWGPRRRADLEQFLARLPVLPSDRTVGAIYGQITGRAQNRGRRRPVNDSWIAACCVRYDLPLLTANRRHFQDFADYDGLSLL